MQAHTSASQGARAAAMTMILYPEKLYDDDSVEREVYGRKARAVFRGLTAMADVADADCDAEGLAIHGLRVTAADIARFAKLRVIVRMGVGYDGVDRAAAAARGIMVCNVPDYGTTEVADHAIAMALALRRGLLLHHDLQRGPAPAAWKAITTPLIRRSGVQTFGIIGLGRIGTAVALRAKAFGFNVVFFDPHRPNGAELALGIGRAKTLQTLLLQADVLSVHAPNTPETWGMLGLGELSVLPYGAIVVNTARGPIIDIDALGALMQEGHIAGAGLDVLPVEPPADPLPALLRAYRERAEWLVGRLIVTPHSAFHSPEAWDDIRRKSAETMAAALIHGKPQNIITPEMY